MTTPEYTWTDNSALWQVKHGELTSDRTESAFLYLHLAITDRSDLYSLAHNLLDTIRELRAECAGPLIEIRTRQED